jgi:glycosyltransferase involved in cell wall biosynthesis
MFTNTYLPHVGGVARSVAIFAEDLNKLGHRVMVVAPTFEDRVEEEREEEIVRVPAIQNFSGSDFSLRIAVPFVIANRIRDFRPDLIHSHHPYLLGDAALRTARRNGLPLIFTHHTLYEEYTHYVPMDSEAMKRFVIALSTEYANLCQRVVAPSRSVAKLIRDRGVCIPIEEIPTGVDLGFFAGGRGDRFRRDRRIPEGTMVLGHVGRLAPEKNLNFLAEAVARALEKRDWVFLVVGEGPSEKEIRRVFRDRGLDPNLVLAGKLNGQDLSDAYDAMDLFVFASKTETQGMVLVEAMASCMPVIALDASGVREVIVDGENGRMLPGDATPEDFAEAVCTFPADPEGLKPWRQHALETAEGFSRQASAGKMIDLYRSMLEERRDRIDTTPGLEPLEKLQRAIKAEWELVLQKAAASATTFRENT